MLVFFVLCGPVEAEEADSLASSLAYSQNADGSWGGQDKGAESQVYTTAKVLEGLAYYGDESGAVDEGISWIKLQEPEDTAALSEIVRVLYLSGSSPQSGVLKLKGYQNTDGGWGKTAGFESTPWYTSSAVIALSPYEDHLNARIAGGEYLLKEQGIAGDFEKSPHITASCVYALVLLYDATKRDEFALAAIKGYKWLNAAANRERVWDSVISTSSSIIAMDALYGLMWDEDLRFQSDNAKEWIVNSPKSFEDPLSDAWALAALTKQAEISPAKPVLSISASLTKDYVFPQEETQIKFKIENRGFGNLKNVSLLLLPGKGLHVEIYETHWKIDSLNAGESLEFVERIYVPGDIKKGEYPIAIKAGSVSADVTLHVMEPPHVSVTRSSELKNDAPAEIPAGSVPSGTLKLVLYGTLALSVAMLLNLLTGYDILR